MWPSLHKKAIIVLLRTATFSNYAIQISNQKTWFKKFDFFEIHYAYNNIIIIITITCYEFVAVYILPAFFFKCY